MKTYETYETYESVNYRPKSKDKLFVTDDKEAAMRPKIRKKLFFVTQICKIL